MHKVCIIGVVILVLEHSLWKHCSENTVLNSLVRWWSSYFLSSSCPKIRLRYQISKISSLVAWIWLLWVMILGLLYLMRVRLSAHLYLRDLLDWRWIIVVLCRWIVSFEFLEILYRLGWCHLQFQCHLRLLRWLLQPKIVVRHEDNWSKMENLSLLTNRELMIPVSVIYREDCAPMESWRVVICNVLVKNYTNELHLQRHVGILMLGILMLDQVQKNKTCHE